MLSIIIATQGSEPPAVATLAALVPGSASGLIRDVLLVDRAGSDTIARVADVAGCAYVAGAGTLAQAWTKGAVGARSPWLLFLCAGAVLDPTWVDEVAQFIQMAGMGGPPRAAVFRHALSPYTRATWPHRFKALARLFGVPSADQGLLIARDHFERLGGYRAQNERQLLRKLGSSRMLLRSRIIVA